MLHDVSTRGLVFAVAYRCPRCARDEDSRPLARMPRLRVAVSLLLFRVSVCVCLFLFTVRPSSSLSALV